MFFLKFLSLRPNDIRIFPIFSRHIPHLNYLRRLIKINKTLVGKIIYNVIIINLFINRTDLEVYTTVICK